MTAYETFVPADDGTCLICGHDIWAHGSTCPERCAGCGRRLEHVTAAGAYECEVCLRYLKADEAWT